MAQAARWRKLASVAAGIPLPSLHCLSSSLSPSSTDKDNANSNNNDNHNHNHNHNHNNDDDDTTSNNINNINNINNTNNDDTASNINNTHTSNSNNHRSSDASSRVSPITGPWTASQTTPTTPITPATTPSTPLTGTSLSISPSLKLILPRHDFAHAIAAREMGYTYELAATIEEALTAMVRNPTALVWMDMPDERIFRALKRHHKLNNMPAIDEATKKSQLGQNLNLMARQFPTEYNIFPRTYVMPFDAALLCTDWEQLRQTGAKPWYIAKPGSSCRGKGIFLLDDPSDVEWEDNTVVQHYVERPLLVNSKKFDLRLYALITSAKPLRLYLCREGLARLCCDDYEVPTAENKEAVCCHLTNYSVNKKHKNYVLNQTGTDEKSTQKWALSTLLAHLASTGIDTNSLWARIADVVVKSIVSIYGALAHNYRIQFPRDVHGGCAFSLLGIDVMIDQQLQPWVIEVNRNPSQRCDSPLDRRIKVALLKTVLRMVDPTPYQLSKEELMADRKERFARKRSDYKLWKRKRDERVLAARLAHEDRVCIEGVRGHAHTANLFSRIFPPTDPDRLAIYDTMLKGSTQVAGDRTKKS